MVNGILWILRTGAPWRDLPARFGPWDSGFFQKIKRNRRIAMRFEKLATHYLAMVTIAAMLVWLA